ncbi:hypothetical protein PVAG01_10508 [Phlyctema vagabunda]|uniref:Uncharacterized protein n=1 Tax=Phlyctema vagabunda TaxID=108571 RepID=A0ABR4P2G5_9HELO
MHFSLIAAVFALGVISTPTSLESLEGPYPGALVSPLEWNIQAFPDGANLTLYGTTQEVHSQLVALNPNYEVDFPWTYDNSTDVEASFTLEKRTDFNGAKRTCFNFPTAALSKIPQTIDYLYGVSGQPTLEAGLGRCSRVSCQYNTAVWWCNDNNSRKTLSSFGSIADGGNYIYPTCCRAECPINTQVPTGCTGCGGQVFHPTNWNVILRADSC